MIDSDSIISEVRKNREQVLIDAGGYRAWRSKLKEQETKLKAEGWNFITLEEVLERKSLQNPVNRD